MVGRSEQVALPGQYLSTQLAGEPILVLRDAQGVLRGFFNVCRHRAAPLLTEESGQVTKLRCRYHGWTYDLCGKLLGTPEFEGVCEFARENNGLIPVSVAEHDSWIWVHIADSGEPIENALAPFSTWANQSEDFRTVEWQSSRTYDVRCNWKVYVDNYLDGGYHVNSVHPGLADVLDYSGYRTVTQGNTALQSSPLRPAEGAAGKTRSGTEAAYWWIFPNFMVNVYSGVMDTNLVIPLGPDLCRVKFDFYFADGTSTEFIEESIRVADRVQAEDVEICEQVQQGLRSRSFDTGRFSVKRENAGYYFHQLLARRLQTSG